MEGGGGGGGGGGGSGGAYGNGSGKLIAALDKGTTATARGSIAGHEKIQRSTPLAPSPPPEFPSNKDAAASVAALAEAASYTAVPTQSRTTQGSTGSSSSRCRRGSNDSHSSRKSEGITVVHRYHDHAYDEPVPMGIDYSHDTEGELDGSLDQKREMILSDPTSPSASLATASPSSANSAAAAAAAAAAPPPMTFCIKLYLVLVAMERDGYEGILSWQPHGRCFVVHDPDRFKAVVMPQYFQLTKMSSFQRQLNLYGFKRLTTGNDRTGYYNELFLRGRLDLVGTIRRVKVKGTCIRARSNPSDEPDFWHAYPWVGVGVGVVHEDDTNRAAAVIVKSKSTAEVAGAPVVASPSAASSISASTSSPRGRRDGKVVQSPSFSPTILHNMGCVEYFDDTPATAPDAAAGNPFSAIKQVICASKGRTVARGKHTTFSHPKLPSIKFPEWMNSSAMDRGIIWKDQGARYSSSPNPLGTPSKNMSLQRALALEQVLRDNLDEWSNLTKNQQARGRREFMRDGCWDDGEDDTLGMMPTSLVPWDDCTNDDYDDDDQGYNYDRYYNDDPIPIAKAAPLLKEDDYWISTMSSKLPERRSMVRDSCTHSSSRFDRALIGRSPLEDCLEGSPFNGTRTSTTDFSICSGLISSKNSSLNMVTFDDDDDDDDDDADDLLALETAATDQVVHFDETEIEMLRFFLDENE